MTATYTNWAGADGYTEQEGWIDPAWSRTILHASRSDVRPLIDCDESDPDLSDMVRDVLGDLSTWEDYKDGRFFSLEFVVNGDESWSYTVQFTRNHNSPSGLVEDAWHPVIDGAITL